MAMRDPCRNSRKGGLAAMLLQGRCALKWFKRAGIGSLPKLRRILQLPEKPLQRRSHSFIHGYVYAVYIIFAESYFDEASEPQSRAVSSEMMPSTPYSANCCIAVGSLTVQTKTFFPAPLILRIRSGSARS